LAPQFFVAGAAVRDKAGAFGVRFNIERQLHDCFNFLPTLCRHREFTEIEFCRENYETKVKFYFSKRLKSKRKINL
jgi:hypothetical protein